MSCFERQAERYRVPEQSLHHQHGCPAPYVSPVSKLIGFDHLSAGAESHPTALVENLQELVWVPLDFTL